MWDGVYNHQRSTGTRLERKIDTMYTGQIRIAMKRNEMKDQQFQDLHANCDQCILKKEGNCPYIEEIVDCHLFNDSRVEKYFMSSKRGNISIRG